MRTIPTIASGGNYFIPILYYGQQKNEFVRSQIQLNQNKKNKTYTKFIQLDQNFNFVKFGD